MNVTNLFLLVMGLTILAYVMAQRKAVYSCGGQQNIRKLHSLPSYYGTYTALWCALPALLVLVAWNLIQPSVISTLVAESLPQKYHDLGGARLDLVVNDVINVATGGISNSDNPDPEILKAANYFNSLQALGTRLRALALVLLAVVLSWLAYSRIEPQFRARNHVERTVRHILIACSSIAVLTTFGIFLSVFFESVRFFQMVPITEFLFGLQWSPQTAIRADQVGSSGAFGIIPLFSGTLLIALIAMLIAVPIGLMTAIYLSEYSPARFRAFAKPALEVLAGIPTVVYGFFAVTTVGPALSSTGAALGIDVSQGAALGVGLVMGIMIIPFVSSLSDDVINAVPQALRDGSYALGATRSETVRKVILPAALPGIVGGVLLAVSRAIGETMIVVMAAGLSANLTANPLEPVTTVTAQIVNLLVGDQEFDSPKTLAAFALGMVLFVVTLCLNIIALRVVRKYREQYT